MEDRRMRKVIGWRLFGLAFLAVSIFFAGPDNGSAQNCCACDFSQCYYHCEAYNCAPSDQACLGACYDDCAQAEQNCIDRCPLLGVC